MTDGIFFHLLESSCKRACRIILSIEKSYSLCKMNKSLNFFEELMRASFQCSSKKSDHYSLDKVNNLFEYVRIILKIYFRSYSDKIKLIPSNISAISALSAGPPIIKLMFQKFSLTFSLSLFPRYRQRQRYRFRFRSVFKNFSPHCSIASIIPLKTSADGSIKPSANKLLL